MILVVGIIGGLPVPNRLLLLAVFAAYKDAYGAERQTDGYQRNQKQMRNHLYLLFSCQIIPFHFCPQKYGKNLFFVGLVETIFYFCTK